MVESICNNLTGKIRKKMPEIDDERAEVINYGLQLLIGEVPKFIIMIILALILNIIELTVLSILFILPYKIVSGGVHLKTHLGCIFFTNLFYVGNAYLSKSIVLDPLYIKYLIISLVWIFGMIMCFLYAPADTEAVPILRKKERKIKKILSYVILTVTLGIAVIIKNSTISNLLIFGSFFQTITITRFVYKITNNKYGYEEYLKQKESIN